MPKDLIRIIGTKVKRIKVRTIIGTKLTEITITEEDIITEIGFKTEMVIGHIEMGIIMTQIKNICHYTIAILELVVQV